MTLSYREARPASPTTTPSDDLTPAKTTDRVRTAAPTPTPVIAAPVE